MGKSPFTDDFKRDAVLQITERGYPVAGQIVTTNLLTRHLPSFGIGQGAKLC